MAAFGGGGYRLGGSLRFLSNAVPYFGFPFAAGIRDIRSFPMRSPHQAILLSLPHLVLIAIILRRGGLKWALIYIAAFYATLLPVLPISKYESQYTYSYSIALAIALALVWDRRLTIAIPVASLILILVIRDLLIQLWMYQTGVCQTRALETLKAVLPDMAPADRHTILIASDTPWMVIARSLRDNSFPLRGEFVTVSVTRDPGQAGLVFHSDCRVSIKDGD